MAKQCNIAIKEHFGGKCERSIRALVRVKGTPETSLGKMDTDSATGRNRRELGGSAIVASFHFLCRAGLNRSALVEVLARQPCAIRTSL